jgi:N-(2-amino-2-carboxyethyl)-L-glutamate synthase
MIEKLKRIGCLIGGTPVHQLNNPDFNLFVKLESLNFTGSIKDRAAYYMIRRGIERGLINDETVVIESSSGNFAVAMSFICSAIGIKFIPVIDPNISPLYERILNVAATQVVKVKQLDRTGGYLLTRIEEVKRLCGTYKNSFWPNQYDNPDNYKAYRTMCEEIEQRFDRLDYLFIAVSSCGTITGLSSVIRRKFPDVRIVAVDVEGSVIFGQTPQKRYVSGIGSSMVPSILSYASVDEVIHVAQLDIIRGCKELLKEQTIFGGVSTGASYFVIKEYFRNRSIDSDSNVLFLCPDRGNAYIDTIYNAEWERELRSKLEVVVE